ncbi:hypothetical protein TPHA_0K02030 [Tetrapisispora phaffii CBS 4417]|uniref:Protein kinase domain-containing protein n=1 Tax=Tetrapisispora phaffii (strain ATCC 24235 / CBS 4417 / NBRC 1672 / NRRL Y-8282 / UCD 70-5) TaxID=1071381 RepID=G8BZK8_TETPH|nr:hypothetical protein TPHA_0K02030 [Tetrapisispora phaffii CBS 4417]CCE65336.1 hypothetical protein TPHA_0K02030 [Tetrapisispora phaffii CBS 4417]
MSEANKNPIYASNAYPVILNDPFNNKFVDLTVASQSARNDQTSLEDRSAALPRTRKQRTISLPQLPYSKLVYQYNFPGDSASIPRASTFQGANFNTVETEDELVNLTGDSAITIESNRLIDITVVRSPSPASRLGRNRNTDSIAATESNSSNESMHSGASNSKHGGHMNVNQFKRRLSSMTSRTSHSKFFKSSNNNIIDANFNGSSQADNDNYFLTDSNGALSESVSRYKSTASSRLSGSSTSANNLTANNFKTEKDGHYQYKDNDIFCDKRFVVKELLGQGTFGKVLKCTDTLNNNHMLAIKVIKAVDRYREAAKTELRILKTIQVNDPAGEFQCILLNDVFDYKNHICIVTELYGKSVYDFMCSNAIARFPGSQVQAVARQLIRSVCFLHDLGIIHTDLKPENILLVDDQKYLTRQLPKEIVNHLSVRRKNASDGGIQKILKNPEIKIIDFGSAIFYNEYHPPVISTRHYRAPEIILGLGWSFPCDIWSIGCVLVELVTGESLYPIHENLEHLAMMERINGTQVPSKLVEKMFYKIMSKLGNLPADISTTVAKHFDKSTYQLKWPETNKRGEIVSTAKSIKRVRDGCDRIDKYLSKKINQDLYGNNPLMVDLNLSPEQNWKLIKSKLSRMDGYKNSPCNYNNYYHLDNFNLNDNTNLNYYYKNEDGSDSLSSGNDMPQSSYLTTGELNTTLTNEKKLLTKETFLFWYYFTDLINKMFEFDPTKRITAKEALEHEWFNLGILDDGITSFNDYLS